MPASRSRKPEPERHQPLRRFWPIALIGLLAIGAIVLIALPASLIARFLPPPIHAEDFSGSIWHGSAARISVGTRPVGALEWRLHPLPLLLLSVVTDLRWVKGSTVIDGNVALESHGFVAHSVRGGGPIDDFRDLGVAPGWHGNTTLDLREIKGSFNEIASANGTVDVSDLSSRTIAEGADLGNYQVTITPDGINADGISTTIKDTGGPLEANAEFHYVAASHTGLLSGTLKERPEASQALRNELSSLSQLKPRDSAGRIPIDLEFSL